MKTFSDTTARNAKPKSKKYLKTVGKGLSLEVHPNGSKRWVFRFRLFNKRPELAIGTYPEVSLARAKELRDEARSQVAEGIDPRAEKQKRKLQRQLKGERTLKAVAEHWYEKHTKDKSDNYKARARRALDKELYPALGRVPIEEITTDMLIPPIKKIEARGHTETAEQTSRIVKQIFVYAERNRWIKYDPARSLTGIVDKHPTTHRAALTEPQEFADLLVTLERHQCTPTVHHALNLLPHLFLRPGELVALEWDDINWHAKLIEVPGRKMKTKKDHIVPLSRQAIALLKKTKLSQTQESRFIFPGARTKTRPLSNNTLRTAMIRAGIAKEAHTPHGFRASARTLIDEELRADPRHIELQLAHKVKDLHGEAYNRTAFLNERKIMMQNWADYIEELKKLAESKKPIIRKFGY